MPACRATSPAEAVTETSARSAAAPPVWSPPWPRSEVVFQSFIDLAPHSVPILSEDLDSDFYRQRWKALWLLGQMSADPAKALVPLLANENKITRGTAAILLARFPEHREAATPAIIEAFSEVCVDRSFEDPVIIDGWALRPGSVRQALRQLGEGALPHLRMLLATEDSEKRAAVEKMIEQILEDS